MELKKRIFYLAFIFFMMLGHRQGFGGIKEHLAHFDFLPEFHLYGEATFFMLQKDTIYAKKYLVEISSDIEAAFVGYRQLVFFLCRLYTNSGIGRSNRIVILDPQDARYAIVPALEARFRLLNASTGLDHFCAHVIEEPQRRGYYWNKVFLNIFSKNHRLGIFQKNIMAEKRPWDYLSRLSYALHLGWFITEGFGDIPDYAVSKGHDYKTEIDLNSRFALYRTKQWYYTSLFRMNLRTGQSGDVYQLYRIGLEANLVQKQNLFSFFIIYNLYDSFPIWSKDKLLELGIRFYK
jgi:hypothetical protein